MAPARLGQPHSQLFQAKQNLSQEKTTFENIISFVTKISTHSCWPWATQQSTISGKSCSGKISAKKRQKFNTFCHANVIT